MPQALDETINKLSDEHSGAMHEEFFVRDRIQHFEDNVECDVTSDMEVGGEPRHIELTCLLDAILAAKDTMYTKLMMLKNERADEHIVELQLKYGVVSD